MSKTSDQWVLFQYKDGEPIPLSKPFKSKAEAEKKRDTFPDRERGRIGIGLVRQ
jgi:hypothetical protein